MGDRNTGERLAMLASRASECGVSIADIHVFESGEAGQYDDLAEVDTIVAALSHALSAGCNIWLPFPLDLLREEHIRRLSLVLQRHGLDLLLGCQLLPCPVHGGFNEVDAALRREVHAVDDLDRAAVAATGVQTLTSEIEAALQQSCEKPTELRVLRPTDARLALLNRLEAVHGPMPPLPVAATAWKRRRPALKRFSCWLLQHCGLTQAEAADILNQLGHRTPSGRNWQRSTVSALVNGRYDRRAVA
ncbi:hypothetical protein [Mycobacterium sp.]|uniref:hypothetical protein n=1 Tax=Mycobacterium sp. TaxID=1785 RepID=UPI0031DAA61E